MRGLADDLGLMGNGVLVPRHALEDLGAHRFDAHRRVGEIPACRRRGDDDRDGPVAGHVTVVEPEWRGDGPCREVVIHRHGVAVDGGRIQRRIPPPVDRDQTEHLARGAVAMQVLIGVDADPVGRGHGPERGAPLAERAGHALRPPAARSMLVLGGQHGERGLPDSAEAEHVSTESRRHGHGGGNHGAARSGEIAATVDPGGVDPQSLFDGAGTALAHPPSGGPGIGRQTVDVVEGQPGIGDRLEAGVDRQRERIDHEPPTECGAADATEHRLVLEALVTEGGAGERPHRLLDPIDRVQFARQLEERKPDILLLLEADRDLLADLHVGGFAADDVGRQVHAGVLGQGDIGDDVGRVEIGQPAMGVHREPHDRGPARHRGRLRRPAPAVGADGHRWVHKLAAVRTALDTQDAVGAGGPEPLVGRGQLGEGPHHSPSDPGTWQTLSFRRRAPRSVLTSTSQSNTVDMLRLRAGLTACRDVGGLKKLA